MTPDTWAPYCSRSVRCPSCRTWSPDLPDPDAVLTWSASHPCTAVPASPENTNRRTA